MEAPSDLQTKYNKIAAEYSKLRSQIPVLKKAVTDEQARCSELKEMLRVRDQCLRIAEAEADSLNFRNQQLTCRVSILLKELEQLRPQEHRGKNEIEVRDLLNEIQKLQQELCLLKNSESKHGLNEERLSQNSRFDDTDLKSGKKDDLSGGDLVSLMKDGIHDSDKDEAINTSSMPHDINEYNDSREEGGYFEPKENTVRWSIQKALEHQLLESQQLLQKTKNEYDQLNASYRALEIKCKELEEKCAGMSTSKITASVKGSISYIPDEEARAREREIKRCFQHRIDLVSNENHNTKSKLLTLEKEVGVMKMRLETETNTSCELSRKVDIEKENVQKVKDELATTVDNYDAQLSAMSDHVTTQNDIIQRQKETIENLQYKLDMALKRVKK